MIDCGEQQMTDQMRSAAQAALDLLSDMTRLRTQPEEAKRMLQSLNSRHADVMMRLLWEVQSYDGSVHYDVLVSSRGGETISLSLSPARSLPWPLRGILRWTEADLVQVNGRRLTIESATCFLDVLWNKIPLMEKIIDLCLLKDELEREPIVVDDDALQDGMDALRRAHGLYTSEATESWMRHRGFTQLQLESMVSEHLAHERLQQRAVAGEVAGYLDSRMHELDVARVALIEVASEAMAFRLREKVSNGASGFVAAMHEAFVTGDPGTTCRFATLRRREAISDIETQLFAAAPGEVVGPVRTGASYVLGCLLDAVQPCDTASAHAAAEQALFDEWLRSRRSEAAITWHWGRLPAESQGPT
jgi:putative peptide maturation system protein